MFTYQELGEKARATIQIKRDNMLCSFLVLLVKRPRGGTCEKRRFIKKTKQKVIFVFLQTSQGSYNILSRVILRNLPIYCLIMNLLKSFKSCLVSCSLALQTIIISYRRISVCSPGGVAGVGDIIYEEKRLKKGATKRKNEFLLVGKTLF